MTITDDDEREAREWLGRAAIGFYETDKRHRATILALLDAPRMPEKPPQQVIDAMHFAWKRNPPNAIAERIWEGMYCAVREALAQPAEPKGPWAIKAPDGSYEGVFIQRSDAERYLQRASGSRIVKLVEAADE